MDHLGHVQYPIKGADLKSACDNWSDVPEGERMHADMLDPEKMYNSADEVKAEIGGGHDMPGSEHQM
jgi:hypothetical protein